MGIISSVGYLITWTIIPSKRLQTLLIDYYAGQRRHKISSNQIKEDFHPSEFREIYLTQEGVKSK
jgi:hypothetical protein